MTACELPPGYLAVAIPKGMLVLTEAEYRRGLLRGKWLTRQAALRKRTERRER